MSGYPLHVDAAGSPRFCNVGYKRDVMLLVGDGPTAHHGVTIATPCRLVADNASPLRFAAVGEVFPMRAKDVREAEARGERWVVLFIDDRAAGVGTVRALFGDRVRIEYAGGAS